MAEFESFNKYLADMLSDVGNIEAGDIGSLIALAFMECAGDYGAVFHALNDAANALREIPAVKNALPELIGARDQIDFGEWG